MKETTADETQEIEPGRLESSETAEALPAISKLDRYELGRSLGRGGFSTVFEAYDPRIKRMVAIKQCSSLDQNNHDRFFREAEIAGNLSHANIVRIFDFGVANGTPFIVQELLGGKDLSEWIESGLQLSNHDRVRILHEVAKGLAYAHSRDVIHRDIKPANVRILDDGSIKLLDFGVAAIQEEPSNLTQAGTTVGTAAYLAPEQIQGQRPDPATDIFSFGVLAYELLTGHRPFEGETLSAVLYQIAHQEPEALRPGPFPGRVIRLVHRCLGKQPSKRPADFGEITDELKEALRDPRLRPPSAVTEPIKTYPEGLPHASSPASTTSPPAHQKPSATRSGIADLPLSSRTPPLRDSSTRIQVAQPRRGPGRAITVLVILLGGLALYGFLGGRFPQTVEAQISELGLQLPRPSPAWLDRINVFGPPPAPAGPVGVPSAEMAGTTLVLAEAEPVNEPDTEPETLDPVTAAIAVLDSQKPPQPPPSKTNSRRDRVAPNAPATLFLPPSWHPKMMVSTNGGPFQSLDRRRVHTLRPGQHKLVFRLDTPDYRTRQTLEVDLDPAESRTIESPLAPPSALRVAVIPETLSGRLEIDGRSLDLPLRSIEVLEPGSHRLTLYPTPADPLGPLAKTVNLTSASHHLVTFDMRRRRAAVESEGPFEWKSD